MSGPQFAIRFADSNPEEFGVPGLAIATADPFGKTLPLGGHIFPNATARLTVADGSLPDDYYTIQFDLAFDAGSAVSHRTIIHEPFDPACGDSCVQVSATGPFRLTGRLTTFAPDEKELFQRGLVGSGVATAGFLVSEGRTPVPFARYEFAPGAAATPEPGTLLLVTAGALGFRWRTRRRRS